MSDLPYPNPRNRRLPAGFYRDPERAVYFTIRATLKTSPFARVRSSPSGIDELTFDQPLCAMIMKCLRSTSERFHCDLAVVCQMPDHVHFLARPSTDKTSTLAMVDQFKGRSTNLSWELGWSGRLWQPRSFDHVVREDESLIEKAEYILNNPVRKRWVSSWQEWPYHGRWDQIL